MDTAILNNTDSR